MDEKFERRKQLIAHKALLVDKRGYVLFLKSSQPDGAGNAWDFPGGQQEYSENPVVCLAREVQEETGLTIDTALSRPFHAMTATGFGIFANEPVTKMFYVAPFPDGEIMLSWEHAEFRWVNPHVPTPDDIQGFTREVLEAYRRAERISGVDERVVGFDGYGLVQLIYGNGKGKTTAALGQAVRCAGAGKRVAIIYFDKGGETHYNERCLIDDIKNIDYWATGRDRIDPDTGRFDFSVTEVDHKEAARGIELVRTAFSGGYDLIVLDEINSTTDLGMVTVDDVMRLLDEKPKGVEVILTGRNPDVRFIERAHLVTEMRLEKHYFYSGVPAREGLDY